MALPSTSTVLRSSLLVPPPLSLSLSPSPSLILLLVSFCNKYRCNRGCRSCWPAWTGSRICRPISRPRSRSSTGSRFSAACALLTVSPRWVVLGQTSSLVTLVDVALFSLSLFPPLSPLNYRSKHGSCRWIWKCRWRPSTKLSSRSKLLLLLLSLSLSLSLFFFVSAFIQIYFVILWLVYTLHYIVRVNEEQR